MWRQPGELQNRNRQISGEQNERVYVSSLARDLLEEVSFRARESEYIDAKSGVSARLSITALQNLVSTAELRLLRSGEENTGVRMSDFIGIIPSITGKIELVYEGEQEGAAIVAENLIGDAVRTQFETYFPKLEKLSKEGERNPYSDVLDWFAYWK